MPRYPVPRRRPPSCARLQFSRVDTRFLAGERYASLVKALAEQPMFECEAPSSIQAARAAYGMQAETSAVNITETGGGETPQRGGDSAAAYSPNYVAGNSGG